MSNKSYSKRYPLNLNKFKINKVIKIQSHICKKKIICFLLKKKEHIISFYFPKTTLKYKYIHTRN